MDARAAVLALAVTSLISPLSEASEIAAGAAESFAPTELVETFRHTAVNGIPVGGSVQFTAVEIADDLIVDLELERFSVLTEDARIVVGADKRPLATPDVVLLRGRIAGEPESSVFIGISPYGTNGFVRSASGLHAISSGGRGHGELRATDIASVAGALDVNCGVHDADQALHPFGWPEQAEVATAAGATGCRILRVAIDTDWEFTANQGGDPSAAAAYAMTIIGAVSELYERDLATRLAIPFLRVWDSLFDSYSAQSSSSALSEFRSLWQADETDVDRELAHLLSGKSLGGGIAYVGAVCSNTYGYGVSGNLNGFFPYPIVNHSGSNWDLIVVAHEIGHNVGTSHTHNYNPVIDGCGNGDCSAAFGGTIMSYCHQCGGGLSNIDLRFHPRVITTITNYLDATVCNISAEGTNAIDDHFVTGSDTPQIIEPLLNDNSVSCEIPQILSFQSTTAANGSVSQLAAGQFGLAKFEYTPLDGFVGTDSFGYTLEGGSSATVTVQVLELLDPVETGPAVSGLRSRFYALDNPTSLPDFDALTPFLESVASRINYIAGLHSPGGEIPSTNVGATFDAFINVQSDGIYTFFLESDDGARMYINDTLVVDNDGLHAPIEASGAIGLVAGAHPCRVEYFQGSGGSTLIARIEGPGIVKRNIYYWQWTRVAQCEADLDGSGDVGFQDLLTMISEWGYCGLNPCTSDIVQSGTVDFNDLVVLLSTWGPCE